MPAPLSVMFLSNGNNALDDLVSRLSLPKRAYAFVAVIVNSALLQLVLDMFPAADALPSVKALRQFRRLCIGV